MGGGSELRSHPFLSTLLPSEKAGAKQPSVSWAHQAVYLEWGRIASSGTRSENEDNLHCLCLPLLRSRPPTAPRSVRRPLLSKPSQGEGLTRVEVPGARPSLRSHAHKTCPPRLASVPSAKPSQVAPMIQGRQKSEFLYEMFRCQNVSTKLEQTKCQRADRFQSPGHSLGLREDDHPGEGGLRG